MGEETYTTVHGRVVRVVFVFVYHYKSNSYELWWDILMLPNDLEQVVQLAGGGLTVIVHLAGDAVRATGFTFFDPLQRADERMLVLSVGP